MVRLEVIGLAFCAAAALGQKITDVIPGALFLASEGDSDFQPQTFKPLSTDSAFQKRLDGLLQIRQSRSCPSGYGACPDGVRCCPSGGRCCTRGCCAAGRWCYSSGCCDLDENGCEQVSCCPKSASCCKGGGCCPSGSYCTTVNGVRGCCRDGQTCTGNSGQCAMASYVRCAGENFCCPPGATCYRDSNGQGKCRTSSAPPPPPPAPSPSSPTQRPTPPVPSNLPTVTPTLPVPSPSSNVPKPVPVLTPPNNSGSNTVQVSSTDSRITWSAMWITAPASCNTTETAKTCSSAGEKITFSFSGATAIYLRANSYFASYVITIDEDVTVYGAAGESAPTNCTYIWYKAGLIVSRSYTVQIVLQGEVELHSAKRAPWGFEFQNFALTVPTNTTGNGGGSNTPNLNLPGNANGITAFTPSVVLVALSLVFMTLVFYSL